MADMIARTHAFGRFAFAACAAFAGMIPLLSTAAAADSEVEEIYVLRSVRESRSDPTDACASARSKLAAPAWEDQYTFRAVTTRPADGRVLEAAEKPAGNIRACFGKTADPAVFDLYGDLEVHGIAGKATGTCRTTKSDFPEKGVRLFACAFELFELTNGYSGGQLTTNSLTSQKLFGVESDPPGYTQVSIATIRLWKKR